MLRLAAAMLIAAFPAFAETAPPLPRHGLSCARVTDLPLPREATVQSDGTLRQAPSIDAPRVTTLGRGETLTVIAECENWREVRTSQGAGWVHRAMLR